MAFGDTGNSRLRSGNEQTEPYQRRLRRRCDEYLRDRIRTSLELALWYFKELTHCCRSGDNAKRSPCWVRERLLDDSIGDGLQRFSVLYGLCSAKYIASG